MKNPATSKIQILGDKHGNVVHLWERDCTLQRRHQKLVEESPCPVIVQKTREELCSAAVRLAKESRPTTPPAPASSSWTRKRSSTS